MNDTPQTPLERLLWWTEQIGGSLKGRGNDEYFEVRTSEFWNLRHAARDYRAALSGGELPLAAASSAAKGEVSGGPAPPHPPEATDSLQTLIAELRGALIALYERSAKNDTMTYYGADDALDKLEAALAAHARRSPTNPENNQMSAHCNVHGCDLVYPAGTWPIGQCPECFLNDRITELENALVGCWRMGQTQGGIRQLVEQVIPDASTRTLP